MESQNDISIREIDEGKLTRTVRRGPNWPIGLKKLSRAELQQLDDLQFATLKEQIVQRGRKRTGNQSFAKSLGRKAELRRRPTKRVQFSKQMLLATRRDCEIMDALIPNRASIWRTDIARRRKRVHVTASDFSFIDNPLGALDTLIKIAKAESDAAEVDVDFLDQQVLDVGPFLVLGIMYERMAPVIRGGRVSEQTMKVLEAVGLRKFLRMNPLGVRMKRGDVWAMPIQRRRGSGKSSSINIATEASRVEITADATARHVDYWLSKVDPPNALTKYGASRIKAFVGEVLNNAERHGRDGGDGEWITAGYMARRTMPVNGVEQLVHVCHLCFFNPGRPISETIVSAPPEIQRQIDTYRRRHRGSGTHHETLATVFALQDGISRIQQGDGEPSGGTGLMDIVEFANEVGRTDVAELTAKVAILSGRAYIRFDLPYEAGRSAGTGEPRLQWFNPDNDVMEPPAGSHVIDMPKRFPGTLIALRFVIDGSFQSTEPPK